MSKSFHLFKQETLVDAPLSGVFEFFAEAENLERITPKRLKFKIVDKSPEMGSGALIDYQLSLMGIPFKWRTEIVEWDPPNLFVDVQLKGPYTHWRHTHTFEARGVQTLMKDEVQYAFWAWFLEPLVHALFVGPQISAIFKARTKAIDEIFGVVESDHLKSFG